MHVDDRLMKDVACGADLPCTFELKCLQRYAMSEDELREHEAREEAFDRADRAARHSRRASRATSRAASRAPSRARAASVHTVSSDTSSS